MDWGPGHLLIREAPIRESLFVSENPITRVTLAGAARYDARDLEIVARHAGLKQLAVHDLRCTLRPLVALPQLTTLTLDDPKTVDGLEELDGLEALTLYSFPKIGSIDPIGSLVNLRKLMLSTPPSYDASRKVHTVESFTPLSRLRRLERLILRGVWPADARLTPLYQLTGLQHLELDHVYGFALADYVRLARALPSTEGHCLVPVFEATWAGTCPKRCGNVRVVLTAPRPKTSRVACPVCDRRRIDRHRAEWDRLAREVID